MRQMKHSVTYRENEKETELFKWVESKSEIIGPSNAIKQMLYELMVKEQQNKNNSK
jgi:transcriptional regulator with GAF, ATPase, and Fis domain